MKNGNSLMLRKFSLEQRSEFAKQNLQYFSRFLGYKNASFHDEWYVFLQPKNDSHHFSPLRHHPQAIKKFHLEAPRKHAKSECVAVNYPSWLIGNYPNIHIQIVSKTSDLAEATSAVMKTRIENSSKYRQVFGNLKPDIPQKWTDHQFIIKRTEISKFPTVKACGLMGALTGGGNDLIILDDVIDEENVRTKLQIEKATTWVHKVLLTTLFPWGGVLAIGTRWSYNDLYSELIEKWPHKIYKAILNEEEITQGQPPKVLWPEFWPYERLMNKKGDIGSIFFNCQYQNNPTGMKGDLLKAEWLQPWEELPSNLELYAGVDPALGEGDRSAIATFGYDREGRQGYLIEVWSAVLPFPQFLVKLRQQHQRYKYLRIFVESNAFQKVLINLEEVQGLPLVGSHTDTNKERRFIPMSSHFEAARVLVNPLLLNRSEFWTEWIQFPRGQFDDELDCVEIVIRNILKTPGEIQVLTGKRSYW